MAKFDLVVRHGTLVIPGMGRVRADVGVVDGRIAALGDDLPGPEEETLDARGKVVLPGVVDPHVHLGNQLTFGEEAHTETRAAVLGGVTTIGVFLRRLDDSYVDYLPAFRKAIEERSFVDALFHLQIFTERQLMEIPRCAAEHGVRSFKFYMSGIPNIVPSITDDFLWEGFRAVASLGPDAIACVHCENGCLVDHARESLKKLPHGTLADWEKAHPPEAEALAIQTAAYLAGRAGAHLYIVHLSSAEGLDVVRACFEFSVETTSPYLGLTSDDENGFLAKMVPPVRGARNGEALWNGLRDGSINLLGTDNTSRTRAAKRPEAGLHDSRPGLPVVGTHLPALLHFGHQLRGVPLELLVDRACRRPAEIYGVYPRKGTIAVGSDADLVVVDLDLERVVDAEFLQGMSDFSPFEGKRIRGWPVATVKGGRIVARDGKIVGAPSGRYLPRHVAAPDAGAMTSRPGSRTGAADDDARRSSRPTPRSS
jgi:dihydropyrimidinase